jgi:hypothetical protein
VPISEVRGGIEPVSACHQLNQQSPTSWGLSTATT